MTDQYFVECDCNRRIRVELFDAGTTKSCPACKTEVKVPSSTKLKELSGDKYPLLRPIEKIQRTLSSSEAPFDGLCHGCRDVEATYEVPIMFKVMVERHVQDEGGIRPTITGEVDLYTGSAQESWMATEFPLLLCTPCHKQFQSANSRAKLMRIFKNVCLFVLGCGFMYFVYHDIEMIAALAGLLSVVGAIAWMAQFRLTKKLDPFVLDWLCKIRWVPEALATEDEYHLTIGKSRLIM